MFPLVNCQGVTKRFGARVLFEGLTLTVGEGERIGLIGPNGAGKSTLLKILGGLDEPDAGDVAVRKQTRLAYVPQDSIFTSDTTVRSELESRLPEGVEIEDREARINAAMGRAGFSGGAQKAAELSGGWRKRLAIAKELVTDPDILLLDEPTNHLDIEGIQWLEGLLAGASFASVVVSHDRYFLEQITTDMAEINRIYPTGIFRARGTYSEFLEKRQDFLTAQARRHEALENAVRREIEWLRRGAKARTTKSKARIDAAGRMMDELAAMDARAKVGTASIDFTGSERKTRKLVAAENLGMSLGGRTLFRGLRCHLSPGVRLGLVGPNGSGKSTLLKILNGSMEPDEGVIERADNLRVVYFDQNRELPALEMPLRKALSPHGDSVIYRNRTIHVAGWAKQFLFRPEQLDMAVGKLSGGEKARVLIARLMLEPADVLMLDEPTNDLDIPTLEVLEESLVDFPGAVVLVTHDRYMLDRVSTVVLGLDGSGGAGLYADYFQWEQAQAEKSAAKPEPAGPPETARQTSAPAAKKRLSYMEAREWEQIESRIQAAELQVAGFEKQLHDPVVTRDGQRLEECYRLMRGAQAEVDRLYERWTELEAKVS